MQNRKFFSKVYECFQDLNIMSSLFMELAHRDNKGYEPVPSNDIDPGVKVEQQVDCMCSYWSYVVHFFADEEWMTRFRSDAFSGPERDYSIRTLKQRVGKHPANTVRIRIVAKRFYSDYCKWNRVSNTNKNTREVTFWSKMEELGIRPLKKQRFKNKLRTVVDLYFRDVQEKLRNLFKGFKMPSWPSEDPELRAQMMSDSPTQFEEEEKQNTNNTVPAEVDQPTLTETWDLDQVLRH